MNDDILLKTANKYLLNDIEGACNPGGRFATILSKLETNGQLSSILLEFLRDRGFHALHRFAAGKIAFEDYRPLAQEEQNTRYRVAEKAAEKAEQERQTLARQMSERDEEMQRAWEAKRHSSELRRTYGFDEFIKRENFQKLMRLLHNLDKGERISDKDFIWLSTQGDDNYECYLTTEVKVCYHRIEAEYLSAEFKRTGDPWHAVNASGHFRKCEEPWRADQLLGGIKISQITDVKLQSGLYTTYGGVKRDLRQFNPAQEFGLRAHELTPSDFRPCTLLGAVHYEQGNFEQGRVWYAKAVERGFKEDQVDYELKTIFWRLDAEKQIEMRAYLLSLDPERYKWAGKSKQVKK